MKRETYESKLNEILGITEEVKEVKKKVEARKGNTQGVSEEEIQHHREMEGIVYFLQAPALFHPRVCKNCGEPFLVSRLHVAYCSYNCIEASILKDYGIRWSRLDELDSDPEHMVQDVYEGNEPIWIRNISTLRKALTVLIQTDLQTSDSEELRSQLADLSPSVESTVITSRPTIPLSMIPSPKL